MSTWISLRGSAATSWSWLLGTALGAGMMYLADPDSGRRRRARIRDRTIHVARITARGTRKAGVDLAHRAQGGVAIVSSKLAGHASAPDEILVERVRAKIGVFCSHPHAIDVFAHNGVVTLSGPILTREARPILRRIDALPGVIEVVDNLVRHDRADNLPALQGGRERRRRPELLQNNWAPAVRLLAGASGSWLVGWGVKRGGLSGGAAAGIGFGLLVRAVTNLSTKRLFGIGAGTRAVDFDKSIHIDVPVSELFTFFRNFENLPRFMSHLQSVEVAGERSHWKAIGPGGVGLGWHAEITQLVENQLIAWRSLPGSVVRSAGVVRFDQAPGGGSLLSVHMSYNPPAGALGHVVAALFGKDPKRALDEDLLRLKTLMETGKASSRGHSVTRAASRVH